MFPFWQSLGTFMEINARNRSIQSSMNRHIKDARRDKNLAATAVSLEHIIEFKGQVADLAR